jgi:hypothetical protein
LDKEREFYFQKLRLIEEMVQKKGFEAHPIGDAVLKILYAGEDEGMDINGDGDLLITAGGQTVTHKIERLEAANPEAEAENNEEMAD